MIDEDLVLNLYGIGAIRFGRFRLTSGIESPFYIDLRVAITHPSIYRRMVKSMAEALSRLNIDIIAGIETASIPWASMIAYELDKGLVYVRKDTKEHGTAKLVEGDLRQGMRVVVVDDVVTTGSSIIRAIRAIRGQGGDVVAAVVFIDREQGGLESVRREGVYAFSLAGITEVIDFLAKRGLISDDLRKSIIDYLVKARGTTVT